jgi:hypothetical protein
MQCGRVPQQLSEASLNLEQPYTSFLFFESLMNVYLDIEDYGRLLFLLATSHSERLLRKRNEDFSMMRIGSSSSKQLRLQYVLEVCQALERQVNTTCNLVADLRAGASGYSSLYAEEWQRYAERSATVPVACVGPCK